MITVLMTGAGGAGTIELIRAMKPLGRYRVIALDACAHAAGFALADRAYVVPLATDGGYRARFERIVREERPDFIVPLVDEEILTVHEVAADCAPSAKVVTPSREFCATALDKWRTYCALRAAKLPTPATWLATEVDEAAFPAVVKPRDGRGSRELAYVDNADELATYLRQRTRPADCYIVQRRLRGREYTVSVVVALGGPVLTVVPKEVLVKRGITQVGVTRQVPALDDLCRQIQERLRADGPFNVQLIVDDAGGPGILEINPRFSTTIALTIAAGVNELDVVVRHARGEPVGSVAFQPDLLMVRYPTQVYVPEAEWPPAAVDRQAGAYAR